MNDSSATGANRVPHESNDPQGSRRPLKLIREPLVHFILAGAGLFLAYAWINRGETEPDPGSDRVIRIGEAEVRWLTETWSLQWHRQPTREDLEGLVADLVKEELLAREARELGLDQDDVIVRRRLAQKMAFLVQDTARLAEPTEADLRRFYDGQPERFRVDARISFTQVYFSPDSRPDAAADARKAIVDLVAPNATTQPDEIGDRLLVGHEFSDSDERTLAGQFGAPFGRAVFACALGSWCGPLESAYGLHLVRVSASTPARQRPFEEVRVEILDRWREQRQKEDDDRYFASLLKKYRIEVDESVRPFLGSLLPTAGAKR